MFPSRARRVFLRDMAAASAAVSLCDLSFLSGLPPVSAADLQPLPGVVPLRAEIEPLVRLLRAVHRPPRQAARGHYRQIALPVVHPRPPKLQRPTAQLTVAPRTGEWPAMPAV